MLRSLEHRTQTARTIAHSQQTEEHHESAAILAHGAEEAANLLWPSPSAGDDSQSLRRFGIMVEGPTADGD